VSQRGAWKDWIIFMLRAIENTSNITFDKINEIVSAKESILNHLTNPRLYAEKTARNYLNTLCEMQVLEKKVIEGKHYYLNLELYRILSE